MTDEAPEKRFHRGFTHRARFFFIPCTFDDASSSLCAVYPWMDELLGSSCRAYAFFCNAIVSPIVSVLDPDCQVLFSVRLVREVEEGEIEAWRRS